MAITKTQLAKRKKYIGSSDVAAILGLDPYQSTYDAWAVKTGKVSEKAPNEAMELGKYLERGIILQTEKRLGKLQKVNMEFQVDGCEHLIDHPDAVVVSRREPVEVKTSGLLSLRTIGWGEAGTDQVPENVIIQSQVHNAALKSAVCNVAALLAGQGFVIFYIPADSELIEIIKNRVGEFWDKYVAKDVPPPDSLVSLEVAKRIRREPQSITTIADDIVRKYQQAKQAEKQVKEILEQAQAELMTALGTAEAGDFSTGRLTYFEQTRKSYVVTEAKYCVLRIKEAKEFVAGEPQKQIT
jgi:putative phage-type endonuclease